MISGFLVLLCLFVAFGSVCWVVLAWINDYKPKNKAIITAACVVIWSYILGVLMDYEKSNPCLKYSTVMVYSSETKTMIPVSQCVQRGRVVKDE